MNEKFFSLPEKKRLAIINSGYRVFSQSSYKKSPMSEIAAAAGISKSLLFHYFRNKKELYLFLIDYALKNTYQYLHDFQCFDGEDFFEIMHRGLIAKAEMMRKYPDLTLFSMKCYYETDEEVCDDIQKIIGRTASFEANAKMMKIDPDKFIDGLDIHMMYTDIYLAAQGYLWEKSHQGQLDVDEVEKDFAKMIDFWKKVYLKGE